MENFCRKVSISLLNNDKDEIEIDQVRYGLEIVLTQAILFVSIVLVGVFLNQVANTLIYIVSFVTLRQLTKGWHADTYAKCYCLTMTSYILIILLATNLDSRLLLITLIPTWIIFFRQIKHNNEEILEYKKRIINSKVSIASFTLILIVFEIFNLTKYANVILLSMFFCAILMIKNTEEIYEK